MAMADIESIVAELESGDLDLTDSLQQYERGIKRLRQCHQLLETAEQKVTLLSGFDADGNPVTEAMPETKFRGSGKQAVGSGAEKRSKGRAGSLTPSLEDSGEDSVDDSSGLF